jgi:hypothetical protein
MSKGAGLCSQLQFPSQQFQRSLRQLFGVLLKLPIEAGIVVCIDAALERSSVNGPIKEPRRDTQRANAITGRPRGTDLVGFAGHVINPWLQMHTPNCALAVEPQDVVLG